MTQTQTYAAAVGHDVVYASAAPAYPSDNGTVRLQNGVEIKAIDEAGHLRRLEEIENDLIKFAIDLYDGHMSEVARRLGIGRSTLYRKVREMGLTVREKE